MIRLGGGTWLRVYVVTYLGFLYAPAMLLPIFAFNEGSIVAFPLRGFTTTWFAELWSSDAVRGAVTNSLLVACSAAVISTALGVCAARAAVRYPFPGKRSAMGLIMLPMVLPEIIVAVALLSVLVQMGFELSLVTVALGHVLLCTPFSVAILSSAFLNLDRSLEEASHDLGVGRIGTFFWVTLPLVMPGIIASLLIAFTISLDEFIIAFFLSGTESTLPVYIWGQLRFTARLPSIMALGTVLLLVSLLLLFAAEHFRRRAARQLGGAGATTVGNQHE